MPKPYLTIRNIPGDVFDRMRERMRREEWHSMQELLVALMRDFAEQRITPSAKPSPYDPSKDKQRDTYQRISKTLAVKVEDEESE